MATEHTMVVLDGYTLNPGDNPWHEIEQFGKLTVHDRTPADKTVERSKGADILFTNKTVLTREVIEQLPDLRYIGVLATGYNVVDTAYARNRQISVTNIPEYGTKSVAQFVFAATLELCHHVGDHARAVSEGQWAKTPDFCFWNYPLVELAEKVIGIIGFGRIGRQIGDLAHAFGMEVRAYDPLKGTTPTYQPFSWVTIERAFESSDVVSLNCPLTDENAQFVNSTLLNRMKPSAFLINAARGGLVHEHDLAEALNAGKIAGASVDVVSAEPIKSDNPLLSARNCIITPHMAWGTTEARKRLMHQAAENLRAYLSGRPANVVNS